MRKILTLFICLSLIICTSGCASKAVNSETAVVDEFFKYYKEADYKGISKVTTSDVKGLTGENLLYDYLKNNLEDIDQSALENYAKDINLYCKELFNTLLISYKIDDIIEKEDGCIVQVVAEIKDFKTIDEKFLNSQMYDYISEHEDEFMDLDDEYEAYTQLFKQFLPVLFDAITEKLQSQQFTTTVIYFHVVKQGNKYLINKIEGSRLPM